MTHAAHRPQGRPNGPRATDHGEHVAQFFRDDDAVVERITALAAGSLSIGEAFILLATARHATAVERDLTTLSIDVEEARSTGRYVFLDAEEMLERLLPDGIPSALLFGEVIGGALSRAAAAHGHVSVYGELVALLWSIGRREAAIRVEELWNELRRLHPFALVCGYPFDGSIDAAGFGMVSDVHDRVDPPAA
jgi:hypothetical protein